MKTFFVFITFIVSPHLTQSCLADTKIELWIHEARHQQTNAIETIIRIRIFDPLFVSKVKIKEASVKFYRNGKVAEIGNARITEIRGGYELLCVMPWKSKGDVGFGFLVERPDGSTLEYEVMPHAIDPSKAPKYEPKNKPKKGPSYESPGLIMLA